VLQKIMIRQTTDLSEKLQIVIRQQLRCVISATFSFTATVGTTNEWRASPAENDRKPAVMSCLRSQIAQVFYLGSCMQRTIASDSEITSSDLDKKLCRPDDDGLTSSLKCSPTCIQK